MDEKKESRLNARTMLAALYVMHGHDWGKMYRAVKKKEMHSHAEFFAAAAQIGGEYIALTDEDYPEQFKKVAMPPFIVLFKGDLAALDRNDLIYVACGDGNRPSPEVLDRFGIDPDKAVWTERENNHVHVGDDLELWFDESDDTSLRMGIAISSKVAVVELISVGLCASIATFAMDIMNKDVFAVPTPKPSANNELIELGGHLLDCPQALKM